MSLVSVHANKIFIYVTIDRTICHKSPLAALFVTIDRTICNYWLHYM